MPRPRRSRTEQIEDAFADLSIAEQERMLADLHKLHRWAKRRAARGCLKRPRKRRTGTRCRRYRTARFSAPWLRTKLRSSPPLA